MENKLAIYRSLNESYKEKFIYHFGTGLGFYSEFNSLLFAVLYCLKNKYQFVLYSKDAQFAFGNGWNEFFEDFCPEFNNNFVGKCIGRDYISNSKKNIICHAYKLLSGNRILNDTYWFCRSSWFEKETFDIPELGIKGGIKEALKVIIPIVYRFNDKYTSLIREFINNVGLPMDYVSFHVRGGDKITERDLITPQTYLELSAKKNDCRNAFVFTDDYSLYLQLKDANPEWNIYTSAFEYETGFVNSHFLAKSHDQLQNELVKIFASVEIILKSELFIGTYSSNPGLFIGMLKDNQMIGLDNERWYII